MKKILLGTTMIAGLLVAGAAQAADMPLKAQRAVPYMFSWQGFYLGINGGWAQDHFQTIAANFVQPNDSGGTFGGQIGYNWQINALVLGLEADANWLNLKGSAPCFNPAFTCNTEVNWQASVRGRLGFAINQFLIYGTGGVAWTTLKGNTFRIATATTFPDSTDRTGWIAGVGAEYAFTPNWIFGVEYLHSDFGKKDQFYDVVYPQVGLTIDQVRARLSYKFW